MDRRKVGVSHRKVDEATDTRQAVRQDRTGKILQWVSATLGAYEAESGRE